MGQCECLNWIDFVLIQFCSLWDFEFVHNFQSIISRYSTITLQQIKRTLISQSNVGRLKINANSQSKYVEVLEMENLSSWQIQCCTFNAWFYANVHAKHFFLTNRNELKLRRHWYVRDRIALHICTYSTIQSRESRKCVVGTYKLM